MDSNITIRFGGDVMLGGGVLEKINRHGPTYPFANLIGQKREHDIFFCNLECTLATNNNAPHPERIHLHSTPETVAGFKQSGINVVSLANNHAFDYALDGFIRTKRILNKHNIQTIGGGACYKEASQVTTIKINDITFSFLGYCSKETGCLHFASHTEYGVANIVPEAMSRDIAEAKETSDIVIVSLHWGDEFRDYPSPKNAILARMLIERGATIIVGHHAHVFQGYERYKHGLILYDLGSVVFGNIIDKYYKYYLTKQKHREGILADCLIGKDGIVDFKFLPIYINNNFQSTFPGKTRTINILRRFQRQSEPIGSASYNSFYKRYIRKMEMTLLYSKAIHLITHPRQLYRKVVKPYVKKFFTGALKR